MGCCSSKNAEEPEDGSPRYSEIGAHCLQSANAHIQMHACAAGYFSCVTTQQLVASDVNEQYILVAMGSSSDAAALAVRMQSLQQIFRLHLAKSVREALEDTARHITSGVPGCSLAVLHIDQKALRLSMACRGGANALVGELVHGLAAQVAEASLLCSHLEAIEGAQKHAGAYSDAAAGQGMAESAPFERGGGTEQQQVQLAERQLLPVHEHIIVGLPPFWAVTSPDAAALRAHFFLRGMSGTHAFGREFQAPCQTAGHLARFAAGQTMHMRGVEAGTGALVITLRWPASSMNQAFWGQGLARELREARPRAAAAAGAAESARQRARQHWRLVQSLLVEYVAAHRRVVQGKWRKAVKLAVAEGVKKAHKLEQEIWLRDNLVVSVSPSLKIRNQKGQEISLTAWANKAR